MPLPRYVNLALERMAYPDPYDDALLETFERRWGGFDLDALLRAVREAGSVAAEGDARYPDEPEQRVFAIFAAAYTGDARARETLAPYLGSANYLERWASALALGHLQDERALPVLFTMLTEYLPPHLWYFRPGFPRWRNEWWRERIPRVLARPWRRPAFVPPLRAAIERILRLEAGAVPEAAGELDALKPGVRATLEGHWDAFADTIVFALGRMTAFGALEGLEAPPERVQLWRVHLAMGALHDQYTRQYFLRWDDRPGLRDAVAGVLEARFGLGAAERREALDRYEVAMLKRYAIEPSAWVDGWD